MADTDTTLDQPVEDAGPATEQSPSAPNVDLEAVIAAALDKRVSGLQSVYDRNLGALRKEIARLKAAGLTQDQQEQLESSEQAEEEARQRQMLELFRYRKQYPDAVEFFIEMMEAEDREKQLELIEQRLGKRAAQAVAAATPVVEAQTPVPSVDRNQPAGDRGPTTASALAGAEMTDELASAVLESNADKGILARLRGKG